MTEQLFSILFSTQTIPPKQNSIDYIFLGWDCHGIEYYLNINGYVSAFSSCLSTEIVILLVCLFAFSVVA